MQNGEHSSSFIDDVTSWLVDLATEYATGAFPDITSILHRMVSSVVITEYHHSVYLRFEGHALKAFDLSYMI